MKAASKTIAKAKGKVDPMHHSRMMLKQRGSSIPQIFQPTI